MPKSEIRSETNRTPSARASVRADSAYIARSRACVGFGLLLLALVGCADRKPDPRIAPADLAVTESPWRYAGRTGKTLVTDHYRIHTTVTTENLLAALPQVVETAYRHYRWLVPTPREPAEKMEVYLFAQRGEFEHFTQQIAPQKAALLKQVRNGGYSEQGVSVIEYVSNEITFPLMTHEGFHQYLHHCVRPNVPAWLNEGLAVYCEGFRVTSAGVGSLDPELNPSRRNALAEALLRNQLIPLDELLRINAGHVISGPNRKIATYYAQAWMLMLFLEQYDWVDDEKRGKYTASFERLRQALANDDLETFAQAEHATSSRPAYSFGQSLFASFVSPDFAAVEREYVRYMRRRVLNEK
jgi:hypothetical protein